MQTTPRPIQVAKTLDVEAVERELAALWKQSAGDAQSHDEARSDDEALLRSCVANLMIFVPSESEIAEAHETLGELSPIHPCRALMIVGERDAEDRDIEMYVSAFCQSGIPSGRRHVCCEEVTLTARGHFVSELPSAAIPLLMPDLPVFLWWRDVPRFDDKFFTRLNDVADRLVIDSAGFKDPLSDLSSLAQFFNRDEHEAAAISDINWARLTSWRALLASFYDVQKYRIELDKIDQVRVDYVASPSRPEALAPQALLIAGWLASQLGWSLAREDRAQNSNGSVAFNFRKDDQPIELELNGVERPEMKPGRLAQVELSSERKQAATFLVSRSADGLHLKTQARIGSNVQPGRLLPVRNRSTAQLLSREMEILCNDSVYEEAISLAARMIRAQTQPANS